MTGGVVSAGVVTAATFDGAACLPAASNAATVYEYEVFGTTVLSVYPGVGTVAIFAPLRRMSYPVTATLSVAALQARVTEFVPPATADRSVTVEGGWASS